MRALDITHDPAPGVDSQALAEQLRQSKDPRILYVISNRRIASSQVALWTWRPYTGSNPHDHHMHISVVEEPALYNATDFWPVHLSTPSAGAGTGPLRPRIKEGDSNSAVAEAQRLLRINVSGNFDAAMDQTVRAFQAAPHGLSVDGIIGPYTWDQLLASSGTSI